ncbi:hypothetical protein HN587_01370 [Candidatus Woesearchaeota archaeon]|jgi:nucleolar protein 56|nr:hypothetical protein [Candidatus Woesearchaeota archaeon]
MYIYSNIIGTFVFDSKFLVVEKVLFDTARLSSILSKLAVGEILDSETILIEKYSSKNPILVGKEKEKVPLQILRYFRTEKHLNLIRSLVIDDVKRKIAKATGRDHLIMQTINQIEELDKIANNIAKRLREWYGLYNPEFGHTIESHEKYADLIIKKSKKELLDELGVIQTMGIDLEEPDLEAIRRVANQLSGLYLLKETQKEYLESVMKTECPNVLELCGPLIGGKFVSLAGGIEKLSSFPASTIQLLGAEKALFRHIKTGARCPKYGILLNHPLVTQTNKKDKAKVARLIADKVSIAAKVDFFKGEFMGAKLNKEIETKINHIKSQSKSNSRTSRTY